MRIKSSITQAIFSAVVDQILEPGEHFPFISALVTLKGFLNKMSFEDKIVQEKARYGEPEKKGLRVTTLQVGVS